MYNKNELQIVPQYYDDKKIQPLLSKERYSFQFKMIINEMRKNTCKLPSVMKYIECLNNDELVVMQSLFSEVKNINKFFSIHKIPRDWMYHTKLSNMKFFLNNYTRNSPELYAHTRKIIIMRIKRCQQKYKYWHQLNIFYTIQAKFEPIEKAIERCMIEQLNINIKNFKIDDFFQKIPGKDFKVYQCRVNNKIDLNTLSFERNTQFKSDELLKMNINCLKMLDRNLLISGALKWLCKYKDVMIPIFKNDLCDKYVKQFEEQINQKHKLQILSSQIQPKQGIQYDNNNQSKRILENDDKTDEKDGDIIKEQKSFNPKLKQEDMEDLNYTQDSKLNCISLE